MRYACDFLTIEYPSSSKEKDRPLSLMAVLFFQGDITLGDANMDMAIK